MPITAESLLIFVANELIGLELLLFAPIHAAKWQSQQTGNLIPVMVKVYPQKKLHTVLLTHLEKR